jgi:hypothetical protein
MEEVKRLDGCRALISLMSQGTVWHIRKDAFNLGDKYPTTVDIIVELKGIREI